MSYDDVCVIAWKGHKVGKGVGKKGPNGAGTKHRGKGADDSGEWQKRRWDERREAINAPRAGKSDRYGDNDK